MIKRFSTSGQATTEMIVLIPLFIMLTGGAMSIGYMCWEGLKVQEAANVAARIQGQERVAGGVQPQDIQNVNGTNQGGDVAPPDANVLAQLGDVKSALSGYHQGAPPVQSVYGKFFKMVKSMFGSGVQNNVFVPAPTVRDNSDEVQVVRVLAPPPILGMKIPPIELEGHAYGGEDPHMYGLPRWGCTGGSACDNSNLFWQKAVTNKNND